MRARERCVLCPECHEVYGELCPCGIGIQSCCCAASPTPPGSSLFHPCGFRCCDFGFIIYSLRQSNPTKRAGLQLARSVSHMNQEIDNRVVKSIVHNIVKQAVSKIVKQQRALQNWIDLVTIAQNSLEAISFFPFYGFPHIDFGSDSSDSDDQ